jgi:hypothetical protein
LVYRKSSKRRLAEEISNASQHIEIHEEILISSVAVTRHKGRRDGRNGTVVSVADLTRRQSFRFSVTRVPCAIERTAGCDGYPGEMVRIRSAWEYIPCNFRACTSLFPPSVSTKRLRSVLTHYITHPFIHISSHCRIYTEVFYRYSICTTQPSVKRLRTYILQLCEPSISDRK